MEASTKTLLADRIAQRFLLEVFATKTTEEKEEEAIEDLVKPLPDKKPPRKDLRNRVIDTEPTEKDRDLSLNYKDAASKLSALYVLSRDFLAEDSEAWESFMDAHGDDVVTNPDTGREVKVRSLRGPEAKDMREKLFEKWKKKHPSEDSSKEEDEPKTEPESKKVQAPLPEDASDWDKFLFHWGDKEVMNPDTGRTVKVRSLRGPKGKSKRDQLFNKWLSRQTKKASVDFLADLFF